MSVRERVLHSFTGYPGDGNFPYTSLTDVNGTLYGTTQYGGAYYGGTVFQITTSGAESVLHSFGMNEDKGGTDGYAPVAGLIDVGGTLYGTTISGGGGSQSSPCSFEGDGGCGTVFAITASGVESVIYPFAGGTDGEHPTAGLVNVNGTLYGTTSYGGGYGCGGYGCGTVFAITPSGGESVIYRFAGGTDGANPNAALTAVNGTLYSTTLSGGAYNGGTGFAITPSGVETVLHSFGGGSRDGTSPFAGLTAVNGTLYGTTYNGGLSGCRRRGCGTVFAITPSGGESVIYRFAGYTDGANPVASLIYVNGMLYGTTENGGGRHSACGRIGCGTIFQITPSGGESVLYSFKRLHGENPLAALIDVNGKLYGTAYYGGTGCSSHYRDGCGTVFSLSL
ncbi:MAG: choice-of-anchor tandem repeat GloVer-containing protein [Candidatus Cybelea sp.]